VDQYKEQIRKIHDRGIGIEGSFIFGSDEDDSSVFPRVVDFCEETKIDAAVFAILTPYPGRASTSNSGTRTASCPGIGICTTWTMWSFVPGK